MRIALLLVSLLMAACASVPQNIKYYSPPVTVSELDRGVIAGSQVPQSFPLDDETAYILGVDGDPVQGGKKAFAQPVFLAPGKHRIAVGWIQGSIFGSFVFSLSVEAGARYVVKHQHPEKYLARIWIENEATGAVIGEPEFVRVTAPDSGAMIPIFIPRGR